MTSALVFLDTADPESVLAIGIDVVSLLPPPPPGPPVDPPFQRALNTRKSGPLYDYLIDQKGQPEDAIVLATNGLEISILPFPGDDPHPEVTTVLAPFPAFLLGPDTREPPAKDSPIVAMIFGQPVGPDPVLYWVQVRRPHSISGP
jgi:hypothetical protein